MNDVPWAVLGEACRGQCICRLSAYGSVLRDEFRHDSDLGLLVE